MTNSNNQSSNNQSKTACFSLENIDSIPGIEPITDKAASACTGGYRVKIELNQSGSHIPMAGLTHLQPLDTPPPYNFDGAHSTLGRYDITGFVVRESKQEQKQQGERIYEVRAYGNNNESQIFTVNAGEKTDIGFDTRLIQVELL